MAGLYDDTPGLSDGTGLWRGRLGLFSGASGFINGSGGAYVDLYFSAGTYSVAGNGYTTLGSIPGFTFTRASLAMGYDATGKLTYGPNNLLLQSQTLDNASWTKTSSVVTANAGVAPDGTTTADKIVVNNGVAAGRVQQVVSATAGTRYLVSAYVKPSGWNWFALRVAEDSAAAVYFDVGTGAVGSVESGWSSASITSAGNGWYRIAAVYTALVGSYTWRFLPTNANSAFPTGDGVNGSLAWGLQVEAVTYQTTPSTYYPTTTAAYYGPRLVYDPVTLASQGILVEEARTNLLLNSQAFDNVTWSKVGSAVTADQTASPDGTSNADTITEDSSTGRHFTFRNTAGLSSSTTYTGSVFLKYLSRQYVVVAVKTGASVTAYSQVVDVQNRTLGAATNTIGSPTATSSRIDLLPNGWCRVSLTIGTGADTNCFVSIGLSNSATPSYSEEVPTYTGNGTGAAYLYHAQLEAGTGASSPIPTTTASVTRAADVARLTGLTLSYPTTLAAGFIRNFGAAAGRGASFYVDGNNFTAIGLNSASAARLDVAAGGVFQAQITGATITNGTAVLEAARVATNDGAFAVNGTLAGTDTAITTPAAPTAVNIGMLSDNGSDSINGTISRIRIYNRAFSDAELQAITQSLLLQEDGYSILQEDNSYIWLE